ncbi:unnamed protein product [Adineta steineri]|uniref:Uncharacterized protein n=1 Tax=Adineta steineri TaxID=433720 RepID=A0A814BY56_9BILA|nr:unnamed protein product [Adineta steineri]CAF3571683.1 unnamed protein product [Adineta steineri]
MTISDEEILVSRPPQFQQRKSPSQPIRIECRAEERHFINSTPLKISGSSKPIRYTTNDSNEPGQYRSEIVVHNNPAVNLYIKKLRVGFHTHDDLALNNTRSPRPATRHHSINGLSDENQRQKSGKYRSISLPRSNSQAMLHQWIDDICSHEKLLANDDICFFLKNGEFLARI